MKIYKLIDKVLFRSLLVIFGIISSELILRVFGYIPWVDIPSNQKPENKVMEQDSELGWIPRAGIFRPVLRDGSQITITINSDRTRKTSNKEIEASKKLIVLGDSVIFGYGVNDEDSMWWLVQERLPNIKVMNYSVAGYGILQNLLRFKREFNNVDLTGSIVVIGHGEYLIPRDIADPTWIESISEFTEKHNLNMPYADLDNNNQLKIVTNEQYYLELPLRDNLASMRIFEILLSSLKAKNRLARASDISQLVVTELVREIKKTGATPILFLRRTETAEPLINKAAIINGIKIIRCLDTRQEDPAYQLPGDSHPGSLVNRSWAECFLDTAPTIFKEEFVVDDKLETSRE